MTKIYSMKLHETLTSEFGGEITRVPGGWIYTVLKGTIHGYAVASVFVPYNNEFAVTIHQGKEQCT